MTRQHTPISYVSGISDTPLKGQTIGDCFDETVSRFPDREALLSLHQGLRYTWRELQAAVDQAARALLALGVAKGDRVGIWSPRSEQHTSELQSRPHLVCRLLLEKKKNILGSQLA